MWWWIGEIVVIALGFRALWLLLRKEYPAELEWKVLVTVAVLSFIVATIATVHGIEFA